jgi:hypothetical protein
LQHPSASSFPAIVGFLPVYDLLSVSSDFDGATVSCPASICSPVTGLDLLAGVFSASSHLGLESSASLLSAWICSPCLDLLALIAPASICLASDPVAQPRSSCRGHQGSPRSEQRRRAAYPRESVAAGGPVTSGLPFRLNFLQNSFVLPRSGLSQCSISRCCPDLGGIGRSLQAQIQIQL